MQESVTTGWVRETKWQPPNSVVWHCHHIRLFCSTAPDCGLEKADTLLILWNTAPNNCFQTILPRGTHDPLREFSFFLPFPGPSSEDQVQPWQSLLQVREVQVLGGSLQTTRQSAAQVDYRHRQDLGWGGYHAFFQRFPTLIATLWFLQISASKLA